VTKGKLAKVKLTKGKVKWRINKEPFELDKQGKIKCDLEHPHRGKHKYLVKEV